MFKKKENYIFTEKFITKSIHTHIHTIHTTFMHEKLILCIWENKFFDLVLTTVEPVQVISKRRLTITTLDLLWY